MCTDIPVTGSNTDVQLTGEAKAQLNGLLRQLGDLNIAGADKYNSAQFNNVLQKDLASSIQNANECRQKVMDKLTPIVVPPPSRLDAPGREKLIAAVQLCDEAEFSKAKAQYAKLLAEFPNQSDVRRARDKCIDTEQTSVDAEVSFLVAPAVYMKDQPDNIYLSRFSLVLDGRYCGLLSNTNGSTSKSCSSLPGTRPFRFTNMSFFNSSGQIVSSGLSCGGFTKIYPNQTEYGVIICIQPPTVKCSITQVNDKFHNFSYNDCPFR